MPDNVFNNKEDNLSDSAMIYPWLADIQQQLMGNALKLEHFPQALLLSGSSGMGKKQLALALAKQLLCQKSIENHNIQTTASGSCQLHAAKEQLNSLQCRSCHLFELGNHPDFYWVKVKDDKKIISVDQIRELIQWSVLTPQLGTKKVIIIEPAEAMNINAANSLLKTLEEPVANTFLILFPQKTRVF